MLNIKVQLLDSNNDQKLLEEKFYSLAISGKEQSQVLQLKPGHVRFIIYIEGLSGSQAAVHARDFVEYSLFVSTGAVKYLNLNDMATNLQKKNSESQVQISGIQTMEQDPDLFVITVPQAGFALLELRDCKGKFKVEIARSYADLRGKEYDHTLAAKKDGLVYTVLNITQPGQYYIAVTMTAANSRDDNLGIYTLQAYYYDAPVKTFDSLPVFKFTPGDQGRIDYQLYQENNKIKLELTWSEIQFDAETVRYISANEAGPSYKLQLTHGTEAESHFQQVCGDQHFYSVEKPDSVVIHISK